MRAYSRSEEHVGEWKVTLWADTLEELFVEAAQVVGRACGVIEEGDPGPWERVSLAARDTETLLVDWINDLIGLSEIHGRAFDETRGLTLRDGELSGEIRGRRVTEWHSPVKAATYHGLELGRQGERWKAVVLLDV